MHRFYCPHTDFSSHKISINNPGEIHHLRNVLRMVKGDVLELFNGQGDQVRGMIESSSALEVVVAVTERSPRKVSCVSIVLACAVPKKAKFETIIEKCTELGVDEIIPMRTARTEVILKDEKGQRKGVRYQAVAVNASKQSARTTIPVVHEQKTFKEVLSMVDGKSLCLIPCLAGKRKVLKDILKSAEDVSRIVVMIGPEGDFTDQEVQAALAAKFVPVSLGETTLKVDTAAIATVAFLRQTLIDDKN